MTAPHDIRGKVGDDPIVGAHQRNSDNQRKREAYPFAQSLIAPVKNRPIARARPPCEDRIQQKRTQKCSGQRSDGQRRDAQAVHQKQAARNGAQVVDQRRECLHAELLAHQQHRAKDSAGEEEQLRGQQNARQPHAQSRFFRVKAIEPPVNVERGENLGQHNGRAQHQKHGGQNHRERALPLLFAPGFAIAREDGDKGDGGRAAHQKIRNHVRQHEGGVEGIGFHAAAKEPGDVFDPHQANDAREKGRGHQHYGCREGRMRMGRAQ